MALGSGLARAQGNLRSNRPLRDGGGLGLCLAVRAELHESIRWWWTYPAVEKCVCMARSSMQREKHLVLGCLARSTPSQPTHHTRHQPPIAQWACESPLGLSCRRQQARSTHAAHACAASHLAGDQTSSGQTQLRPVRRRVVRERWRKAEEDPDGACSGAGCRGCGCDWAPWGIQDRRLLDSDYMTL